MAETPAADSGDRDRRLLRERAHQLSRARVEAHEVGEEVVVLESGSFRCAVPVRRLREVTPLTAPGAVPRGRHPFEAIHATRGELVPLVDVARLATGRAAPASARRFAVMVDDPEPFGLIAEHVSITEASARLSPPSASPEWVVGIDPTGVAYLDPVRLSSRLRDHGAAPPDTTATSPPPDEGAP